MILFCEDCGEKNKVNFQFSKNKQETFRCTVCNYLNFYHLAPSKKECPEKAALIFKEALLLPDIIGSFLFHTKTGVLKNKMPGLLKGTDLQILGKLLTQNYQACQSHYSDVFEMAIKISNKHLIVKKIAQDIFIILACDRFPLLQNITDKLGQLAKEYVS